MRKALFVGSFDPFHNGHREVVEWGLEAFDEIVVVIANNENKKHWFSQEERKELAQMSLKGIEQVRVRTASRKDIVDIAKEEGIYNVLRGVKAGGNLEEEIQLQEYVKFLCDEPIQFYFKITTNADFRSSSVVKVLAFEGKEEKLEGFICKEIKPMVCKRAKEFQIEIK